MVQLFVTGYGSSECVDIKSTSSLNELYNIVALKFQLNEDQFFLTSMGGSKMFRPCDDRACDCSLYAGDTLLFQMRLVGGIDFQHREGSKVGSGGQLSEAQVFHVAGFDLCLYNLISNRPH